MADKQSAETLFPCPFCGATRSSSIYRGTCRTSPRARMQSSGEDAMRDAAPAVQGEPVAYISQEDFEFLLSDDMSEQYGTRQAPVFSRKDYRVSVPLYASPQPPAQDVSALVAALEDIRSRSSMNLAMRLDPFELIARLGDIYQIADAALAKENSND